MSQTHSAVEFVCRVLKILIIYKKKIKSLMQTMVISLVKGKRMEMNDDLKFQLLAVAYCSFTGDKSSSSNLFLLNNGSSLVKSTET